MKQKTKKEKWWNIDSAPLETPVMVFVPRGKHKGCVIAWRQMEYFPSHYWLLDETWETLRVTPTKWRNLTDEDHAIE